MKAIDRVLRALSERGEVKQCSREWKCVCPAHEDSNPSLDVCVGDDGRVLLVCRSAGCPADRIVSALGLTMSDLFDRGSEPKARKQIVCTYDYRDENGVMLFQAVRFEPKEFRQRRSDGNGGWVWKLEGVRRVLYRLPELLAADPAAVVFVCEGEKDVDALIALGLVATTNPMGAGKWGKHAAEYGEPLRGRRVVVIPDNDKPGRSHASTVRKSLTGVATIVAQLDLPGLPEKGDVSDWLAAGGTAEQLLELAEQQLQADPQSSSESSAEEPEPAPRTDGSPVFSDTDIANGWRFATDHVDTVRFVADWEQWVVYDGRRWEWTGARRAWNSSPRKPPTAWPVKRP